MLIFYSVSLELLWDFLKDVLRKIRFLKESILFWKCLQHILAGLGDFFLDILKVDDNIKGGGR